MLVGGMTGRRAVDFCPYFQRWAGPIGSDKCRHNKQNSADFVCYLKRDNRCQTPSDVVQTWRKPG